MTLTLRWSTLIVLVASVPLMPNAARAQSTVQDSIAIAFANWYHSSIDLSGTNGPIPHVELDTASSVKAFVGPFLAQFPQATVVRIDAPLRAYLTVTKVIVNGDSATVLVHSVTSRPLADGRSSDFSDSRYTYTFARTSVGWSPGTRLLTSARDGTWTRVP